MINNTMEVIAWINLELLSYEIRISRECRQVKVLNWKINEILEFTPVVAEKLEAFKLNDENWGWNKHLHSLEMNLRRITLLTCSFIL